MTFTFLGTGTSQGIPVIGCTCEVCTSSDEKNKRQRCAALIQSADKNILIDGGPDIRVQLLRTQISSIEAVFLTHEHYDHLGGLDDLRPIGFLQNGIHLYGLTRVLDQVKIKYDYAFGEQKYPGAPKFHLHKLVDESTTVIEGVQIVPLTIHHGELDILGYLMDNKLMYITDANGIPQNTLEKIYGIDTLVINALHHTPHHSHYTLAQTLEMITLIKPKQAYLIHLSHHMGLHHQVEKLLPNNVKLAYDGLCLEL